MNLFKKIYCRTFQTVLKLSIPLLPYRTPEILDSVFRIPGVLQQNEIQQVLIVTDPSIHELGLVEPLKEALRAARIHYTIYDKTIPNPTVGNVEEAVKLYSQNQCQALIGFGGGSAIDCAKAVGARITRPNKPIHRMKGILKILRPIPFMIAIPTTAGTGSETTVTTVITDETTQRKYAISDLVLIPHIAVHDPSITVSLPPFMTATTGMDALTHAIEAYIGRSTVKSTRKDALDAVALIAEYLERAYRNGSDTQARTAMLTASFLAGRAFAKSYVGYCHAVAHTLGGKYHIPHGLANAVLLPYVLEAYGPSIYKKAHKLAIAMKLVDDTTLPKQATEILIAKIREMNKNMNIPEKLENINPADIPKLAGYAEKEANPLYPVPFLMTAKELECFYYDVMEDIKCPS